MLVGGLGFDPVNAGGLSESWRFEPNTVVYLVPYAAPERKQLADLRSTPATPAGREKLRHLLSVAERTDQATRVF